MKNGTKRILIGIFLALSTTSSIHPSTLLYSMKIRRIFTEGRNGFKKNESICAFSVVPIVSARNRHFCELAPLADITEKRITIGSIFDFRCSLTNNLWFEVTTAIENERAKAKGVSDDPLLPVIPKVSRTGMDDITFEAGYHMYPTDNMQFDFFGIVGFPTHTKVSCEDALGPFVGSRLIGLGFGGEVSYSFIGEVARSLIIITQTRLLHFFSRFWDPVLPCGGRITPGEVVDVLVALKYREKHENFEVGYNPTLFFNQAITIPEVGKIRTEDYVRNGAYAKYSHLFVERKHPISLGCGFAFNRTQHDKSRVYDAWLSFAIIF